ncbi:hypothetical protein HG264_03490 [Pseudomonas sp. gcc21]|uniref:hypothetical protein n=1 Tax=Pseudomonas sp. gcc21 TaxID=2726989 RepID=UPI001451F764|nr:hypothetical protein [Pseudomonas sp. gcc21]QJD58034.1 hypothetical protein HG264_03490 [Pseudomonas sp. gcc21]
MFIDFKSHQSRCREPLLHHTTVALVAVVTSVLIALVGLEGESASARNHSSLAAEPDIAWPGSEPPEAGGLTRYEISIDDPFQIQAPIRFVF